MFVSFFKKGRRVSRKWNSALRSAFCAPARWLFCADSAWGLGRAGGSTLKKTIEGTSSSPKEAEFCLFVRRYFEGGVSSVYLWDLDHGFAGVILIKKAGDGSKKIKGCWDSIHVVEVQVRPGLGWGGGGSPAVPEQGGDRPPTPG